MPSSEKPKSPSPSEPTARFAGEWMGPTAAFKESMMEYQRTTLEQDLAATKLREAVLDEMLAASFTISELHRIIRELEDRLPQPYYPVSVVADE